MTPLVARRLALALACGLAGGCVNLRWETDTRFEPVSQAVCDSLAIGSTRIDACLRRLGAPLWVWETAEGGQPGAVLAYGWYLARDRKLRITFPLTSRAKGNFDYRQIDGALQGLVLFFDADWTLVRWRRGSMRDITADIEGARRARAASVDLDERRAATPAGTQGS